MAALWFAVVQNTQIKSVKPKETKSRIQFKNESVSPLLYTVTLAVMGVEINCWLAFKDKNKEERYSRVPRLSDIRYSAIWRYASSKARLKCATYRRYTDLSVMGVRVSVANFFWINR